MRETIAAENVYDIVAVGGGPAGAAAALSALRLRPGLRVAIVEPSTREDWRAGESLAPGCQEILRGLDCWERFRAEFQESPGTCAAWGAATPYENDFLFSTRGSGWHVERARFDAMMRAAAHEAGAEVLVGRRLRGMDRDEAGFRLRLGESAQDEFTVWARFAIDATGRRANLAARCGSRVLADDRLVGVCGTLAAANCEATTLVEAQPDGWWYSSPAPGGRAIVAWMSDADLIRRDRMCDAEQWRDALERTAWTRERVNARDLRELRVWTANSQRLSRVRGDGWVAAGEAATAYDPLSSCGILKALRSGKVAAFVAIDALEGRDTSPRYERLVAAEYAGYRETRRKFYGQEQRWPDSPFWRRRNGKDATWQTMNN
ncbi:MAG TPA: tryptophan 7-halogenase [Bryobacteraceae bacterium]|nr:tryptophan 7-halogenase [Bryobacteraceae bacterium]